MISLTEQIKIIIHFLILGFFFGATYDFINILFGNLNKHKQVIKYLIEIIYWFLFTALSLLYIIKNVVENIRLYSIIFFIIGIFLYFVFFSKENKNRLTKIKQIISKIKKKIHPILILFIYPAFPIKPKQLLKSIKKLFKRKRKNKNENLKETTSSD